jgi:hypothetical protein
LPIADRAAVFDFLRAGARLRAEAISRNFDVAA